jgi:hypothetical protein
MRGFRWFMDLMWWLGWERQWFGLTADGGSGGKHCLGWLGNGSCIIVFGLGNYRAITKKWVAYIETFKL